MERAGSVLRGCLISIAFLVVSAAGYPIAPDPADYAWTGAGGIDWFVAGNWSPAGPPGPVASASVNAPEIAPATVLPWTGNPSAYPAVVASLCVGQTASGHVQVTHDPLGTIPLTVSGTAWVGYQHDSALPLFARLQLGGGGGGGAVTPTVRVGTLAAPGALYVGCDAAAVVSVSSNTWLDVLGTTVIGAGPASYFGERDVIVQGGKFTTTDLIIGAVSDYTGMANLRVESGGSCVVSNTTVVGDEAGGIGAFATSIGSTLDVGDCVIGRAGLGDGWVTTDGHLTSRSLTLAEAPGSYGGLYVQGNTSTASLNGLLTIGKAGSSATVYGQMGAQVSHVGDCYIAQEPASGGNLYLNTDATWTTTGTLYIGGDGGGGGGRGTVQVRGGATLQAAGGIVVYGDPPADLFSVLAVQAPSTVTAPTVQLLGGELRGGTIIGHVTSDAGVVYPHHSGTLTIDGNYATLDVESRVYIELWGTGYIWGGPGPGTTHDRVNVLGTANLGGGLGLTFYTSAWTPQAGDMFEIFSATQGFGGSAFDSWWYSVQGPPFGLNVALEYTPTSVIVRLRGEGGGGGGDGEIPEPSTLAVLALAGLGLLRRRRR
ncbi:MAG TPA: PEP-CTERM sorting domain-containing protein [Planctomycetota bacterium]|nr:PEP-CTERM sorting domain-containing protein [Planctomycetota bacterium]HRR82506.1 PEP-CTERM sorting domain-containing protein [Planctomycetota bacterium]HRT93603.1 PEP-CTERM sorting domain-containing protein [Planctomycetota bacterium]